MANAEKFRVAVVGITTEIAQKFLPELFYSPIIRLVAVCDKNCEAMRQICETYLINGYRTYEELIENEEIDFAIITIPKAA